MGKADRHVARPGLCDCLNAAELIIATIIDFEVGYTDRALHATTGCLLN